MLDAARKNGGQRAPGLGEAGDTLRSSCRTGTPVYGAARAGLDQGTTAQQWLDMASGFMVTEDR
jgi:hypothetical protein